MDVKQYLKKIGCEDAGEKVNLENLTRIRDGHNRTFTFENLDIHMKIPIKLSLEDAYNRLMNNSRGGYCLQLNFVLAWALKELGYDTMLLSVYIYSRGFDVYDNWPVHVGIVVNLDGKQYYVDAGTTRFISQPIEIVLDKDQKGKFGVYKFIKDEENPGYLRLKRSRNVQNNEKLEYEDQLRIKLDEPKQMEDFIEMNEYVQTEKHPMLFYRTLCVRQSENMVYFLAGWKYSEITFNEFGETRVDKIVETIEEIRDILRNKFDLIVDDSFQPVDIQK